MFKPGDSLLEMVDDIRPPRNTQCYYFSVNEKESSNGSSFTKRMLSHALRRALEQPPYHAQDGTVACRCKLHECTAKLTKHGNIQGMTNCDSHTLPTFQLFWQLEHSSDCHESSLSNRHSLRRRFTLSLGSVRTWNSQIGRSLIHDEGEPDCHDCTMIIYFLKTNRSW